MSYWYFVGGYLAVALMVAGFKSALSETSIDDGDIQASLFWPLLFLILLGGLPVIAYRAWEKRPR